MSTNPTTFRPAGHILRRTMAGAIVMATVAKVTGIVTVLTMIATTVSAAVMVDRIVIGSKPGLLSR
jgi:hypothetical protein